jgi:putative hydrolase of the HAD superfamily
MTNAPHPYQVPFSWTDIDTVLLDMDGTLLDLHYDNTLWTRLLPQRISEVRNQPLDEVQAMLDEHMTRTRHRIEFYCLDYWSEFTGLDMPALHLELTDLIRYRPGAELFLEHLGHANINRVLITNAHPHSFDVKDRFSKISERLDLCISCHDFGAPKEDEAFWHAFSAVHPFDPARSLFIDDTEKVLDAAALFGIRHLMMVAQPDGERPARTDLTHPALHDFHSILPTGRL